MAGATEQGKSVARKSLPLGRAKQINDAIIGPGGDELGELNKGVNGPTFGG